MEPIIVLAGMTSESTVDGPGIRLTLYLQGCPHHCIGCHNPDTWDEQSGQRLSVNAALDLIAKHLTPLHQGITLSGGEPFFQPAASLQLVSGLRTRFPHLNIWCYTGYTYEELLESPILPLIDVLIDGPFIEAERELDLVYRGSKNQRIIAVKASLQAGKVIEHLVTKD
ncbi:MAG: anaerobic ribonucleoside-triphosphate reductase activating protein [Methanomassiliicoccales archaeon]